MLLEEWVVILTEEEEQLLKQLKAAGVHGRTIGSPTPTGLIRLVRAGLVSDRAASLDGALYRITPLGEEFLATSVLDY
jgi:DNA-binding PadR family transcriptional regulator